MCAPHALVLKALLVLIEKIMPKYSKGPFRFRTWLRSRLPWFVINTGIVNKGVDCEQNGGFHEWYKEDETHSACYHCSIVVQGKKC